MSLLCDVPVGCPKSSPWGTVQDGRKLAEGIFTVSTAGHGGIKCDRKANARIPALFRQPGGWYEEDCDWAIPAIFLDCIPNSLEDAHKALKSYNWREYEQHFHVTLAPGESYGKDGYLFKTANADKWIVISAWGDWHERVPKGWVGCCAIRSERSNKRFYLVPEAEYQARAVFGFVIDEAVHGIWEGPDA